MIDADNERLQHQLAELKATRAELSRQSRAEQEENTPRPAPKRDVRPIPGIALNSFNCLNHLSDISYTSVFSILISCRFCYVKLISSTCRRHRIWMVTLKNRIVSKYEC